MKTHKIKIFVCLIIVILFSFVFAGCGNDSGNSQSENNGAAVENDLALEKYISDIRAKTEETIASAKEKGMIYSVFARGSAIVHRYKYIEDIGNLKTARSLFETYSDSFDKAAKDEIAKLEEAGVKSPSVIFVYTNFDGEEIYVGEFK